MEYHRRKKGYNRRTDLYKIKGEVVNKQAPIYDNHNTNQSDH